GMQNEIECYHYLQQVALQLLPVVLRQYQFMLDRSRAAISQLKELAERIEHEERHDVRFYERCVTLCSDNTFLQVLN
ncbi:MAG TPA: hypothetical protein VLG38_02410, partial [Gammaproteobacteria bacterium]|nr:hypothetical protein [Gammaproteobacteria bacterium]